MSQPSSPDGRATELESESSFPDDPDERFSLTGGSPSGLRTWVPMLSLSQDSVILLRNDLPFGSPALPPPCRELHECCFDSLPGGSPVPDVLPFFITPLKSWSTKTWDDACPRSRKRVRVLPECDLASDAASVARASPTSLPRTRSQCNDEQSFLGRRDRTCSIMEITMPSAQ